MGNALKTHKPPSDTLIPDNPNIEMLKKGVSAMDASSAPGRCTSCSCVKNTYVRNCIIFGNGNPNKYDFTAVIITDEYWWGCSLLYSFRGYLYRIRLYDDVDKSTIIFREQNNTIAIAESYEEIKYEAVFDVERLVRICKLMNRMDEFARDSLNAARYFTSHGMIWTRIVALGVAFKLDFSHTDMLCVSQVYYGGVIALFLCAGALNTTAQKIRISNFPYSNEPL